MANYQCRIRTNTFSVKDLSSFKQDFSDLTEDNSLRIKERATEDDPNKVTLLWEHPDGHGFPTHYPENEDGSEGPEMCIIERISEHLADNEVAIITEVGHEKFSYLIGESFAFNNKGDVRRISLDDIMDLAKEIAPEGTSISEPNY